MAITQCLPSSFLSQLLTATHDFSTDVFKIALYDSNASMGSSTTAYTATDEVVASAYTAGGATLTTAAPVVAGGVAYVDFVDVTWAGEITASGALIYNSSKSDKAVAVLSFGGSVTKNPFVVTFPSADGYNAIIRISD